jgi:uncharacterized protein (TIGR02996 family)
MTDLTALVRPVVFTPWDNALRLILADYLEDGGHEEEAKSLRAEP